MSQLARVESAEVRALLYQTMDPTHSGLYRLPMDGSSFQSIGTAVAKNYKAYRLDFSLPVLTTHDAVLPAHTSGNKRNLLSDTTYYPVVVTRDPVVAFIDIIANNDGTEDPAPETAVYSTELVVLESSADGLYAFNGNGSTGFLNFGDLEWTSGHNKYGKLIPTGTMALGSSLVWIDAGAAAASASATLRLAITSITGKADKLHVWLHRVVNDTIRTGVEYFTVTEQGETGQYLAEVAIQECGYYQVQVTLLADIGCNFQTLTLMQRANVITRHHTLDAHETASNQIDELRVLGQSILLSNTTASVNLQGSVFAAMMMSTMPWYDYVADMETHIFDAAADLRYQGQWAKGFYGFVKPHSKGNLDLQPTYFPVEELRFSAFRPFVNLGSFIALVTRADSAVAGTSSANSVTLMATRTFEFTTNSQMFALETSKFPTSVYEEYAEALRKATPFHENPLHWSDITSFIKRAANWVGGVAGKVANNMQGAAASAITKWLGL